MRIPAAKEATLARFDACSALKEAVADVEQVIEAIVERFDARARRVGSQKTGKSFYSSPVNAADGKHGNDDPTRCGPGHVPAAPACPA